MIQLLVIDDDADFRNTVGEILRQDGLSVRYAASGREGLAMLSRQRDDIVLLDLVLPGMDGLEVLREILRLDERIKVILVTAFATIENTVEGIKLGACDVLAKPFRIAEFRTLMARTVEELRIERAARSIDIDPLLGCLVQPIRKSVADLLDRAGALRMSDLMRELGVSDHAKLAFHLRHLMEQGIIVKSEERFYALTPLGRHLLMGLRKLALHMSQPGVA